MVVIEGLAAVLAIVGVVGCFLVVLGFWPHASADLGRAKADIARGVIWTVGSLGLRGFYWDVVRFAAIRLEVAPQVWASWREAVGLSVNVVFASGLIIGLYFFLRVLVWMVPPEDRRPWMVGLSQVVCTGSADRRWLLRGRWRGR